MTGRQATIILWVLAAACLLMLLYLAPMPANAQQAPCGDRDKIITMLKAKYKEIRVATAITAGDALIEVFAAPSGTYTILMTTPGKITCIVNAGDSWQEIPDPGTGL